MQNKPKFKIGEEVVAIFTETPDYGKEYLQIHNTRIKAIRKARLMLYELEDCQYVALGKNLFTKEEAKLKIEEFLNAK